MPSFMLEIKCGNKSVALPRAATSVIENQNDKGITLDDDKGITLVAPGVSIAVYGVTYVDIVNAIEGDTGLKVKAFRAQYQNPGI